jgi:glycosyltransferase involved in cell wall biosynthesis
MSKVSGRSVSVVIPTYNRLSFLRETLNALSEQTYPSSLVQVIVVDDCSKDETPGFIEAAETPFELRAVHHTTNKGRAAARNTGIREADGDLVLFVDDDMRSKPDLIEQHVAFQESHGESMVIGSALQAPELGTSTVYTYLDRMGVHKLEPGSRVPARYFVTNNSSVPRKALLDVGLFDESFTNYGFEDTEIAFRLEDNLRLASWYCGEAVAFHLHAQTLDDILAKREEAVRPLRRLLQLHPERASELSVDVLMPPAAGDSLSLRSKKLLIFLATNPLGYLLVRGTARRIQLGPLSVPALTYLIACRYRRALAV